VNINISAFSSPSSSLPTPPLPPLPPFPPASPSAFIAPPISPSNPSSSPSFSDLRSVVVSSSSSNINSETTHVVVGDCCNLLKNLCKLANTNTEMFLNENSGKQARRSVVVADASGTSPLLIKQKILCFQTLFSILHKCGEVLSSWPKISFIIRDYLISAVLENAGFPNSLVYKYSISIVCQILKYYHLKFKDEIGALMEVYLNVQGASIVSQDLFVICFKNLCSFYCF
jgi:hypothetical protein